jgi:hypothetical protein
VVEAACLAGAKAAAEARREAKTANFMVKLLVVAETIMSDVESEGEQLRLAPQVEKGSFGYRRNS